MADPVARVLRPRRPRLAEALAAVTDRDVDWWRESIAGHGGGARDLRWSDSHGACFYMQGCREPAGRPGNQVRCVGDVTITDPAEAWEAITTRLDLEGWVDARRGFRGLAPCHCDQTRLPSQLCGPCRGIEQVRATPWTLEACVALAADVPGVLTAEMLAREITGRERFVWKVVPATETNRFHESTASLHHRINAFPRATTARLLAVHRELWRLGYALDAVTDQAVVLVAPGLA